MLNVNKVKAVYLACGSTDLRKSIDGLTIIIQQEFKLDPFSSSIFVFCNQTRDKLKIVHWEHNGFWLYCRLCRYQHKRYYSEHFKIPNLYNIPIIFDIFRQKFGIIYC